MTAHTPAEFGARDSLPETLTVLLEAVAFLAVASSLVLPGGGALRLLVFHELRSEGVWVPGRDLLSGFQNQMFVSRSVAAGRAVTLGGALPTCRETLAVQLETPRLPAVSRLEFGVSVRLNFRLGAEFSGSVGLGHILREGLLSHLERLRSRQRLLEEHQSGLLEGVCGVVVEEFQ